VAIIKSALRRDKPESIKPVTLDFAARFQRLTHYRHSADVLQYGARLLESHGDITGAFGLLKAAVRLMWTACNGDYKGCGPI